MKKTNAPGISLRRLIGLVREDAFPAIGSAVLSLGGVLFSLRLPVLIGRAIDLLAEQGNVDLKAVSAVLLRCVLFAACCALLQWLSTLLSNRVAYSASARLRTETFTHLQDLPLSYLDKVKTGDMVSRIVSDADTFSDGLLIGTSQFISGAVTIVGTLISMVRINLPIALLVLLLTPVSFLVSRFIATRIHDMFVAQTESKGRESAFLDETLSGQKVIKGLCREQDRIDAFDRLDDELTSNTIKAVFYSSVINPATRFVNAIIYAAVACVGALLCIRSETFLTVGSLSALLSFASGYARPFNEISSVFAELQNAMVCAGRLVEILDTEPQAPDAPDAAVLSGVDGRVTAEDVSFSYDKSRKLLEHLSFTAEPGQKIAIVGPTGCGKTTIINLLMRFYEPDLGRFTIDGTDISQATRASVRSSYGMVLQDTWLRTGTVRDNIAVGHPEATEQEIVAAAKAARADGFIRRLPKGYDTVVNDSEGTLSAGQKQLLCLARVMLRTPEMLILDEATSSIDTRTELLVQRAFDELMTGRTSFVVAHRLSTIRRADLILVIKDGSIIEQGTHEQLLEADGFYRMLYHSQFDLRD